MSLEGLPYRSCIIVAATMICCYGVLLIWTLIQAKLYLVDQRRYRNSQTTIFYVLAIAIEAGRIVQYFNFIT